MPPLTRLAWMPAFAGMTQDKRRKPRTEMRERNGMAHAGEGLSP
jgi:hypothetical protein